MENIIYEAGYLATYILNELQIQNRAYPIYFHIDLEDNKKTKEFNSGSLKDDILEAINILDANTKNTKSNLIIIPAEVTNNQSDRENAIVAIVFDNIYKKSITISIPFRVKNNKLYVRCYEILDNNNIKR